MDLADCDDSLADRLGNSMSLNLGERPAVLETCRKALEVDLQAAALEPANRRAQRSLAVEYAKLGDSLADSNEPGRAGRVQAIAGPVSGTVGQRPVSALARGDVAKLYQRLGSALKEAGRYQKSLACSSQKLRPRRNQAPVTFCNVQS